MTFKSFSDAPITAYLVWLAVGGGIFLYYAIRKTLLPHPPADPSLFYITTAFFSVFLSGLSAVLSYFRYRKKLTTKRDRILLTGTVLVCSLCFFIAFILVANWNFANKLIRHESFRLASKHMESWGTGGRPIVSPWRLVLTDPAGDEKMEIGVDARFYRFSELNDRIVVSTVSGLWFGEYVVNTHNVDAE